MNNRLIQTDQMSEKQIQFARRAFYALCTHIDHQIRVVLGTIREAGLLDNTVIMFLADHGDMLGNHGLFAKRLFYEDSACVPMLLVGTRGDKRVSPNGTDNRLVGLQDCMPTLLDLCNIDIPETVDGRSLVGSETRDYLYGEYGEGFETTRMLHDGRHKLIYYAAGNRLQLFDLETDPQELTDLVESPEHQQIKQTLTEKLLSEFYGADTELVEDGVLRGLPNPPLEWPDRNLSLQRGTHWPVPPQS
jgi:arylsulfatase A-like enzyme